MNAVGEPAAPQDSSEPRVKVLYIMGWGRSGSTIMDNLLGGIDGFFSVGELGYLWERGLVEGRRCGCGRLLRDCEVWSEVLREGFGAALGGEVDPEEIVAWQRDVVRVRHTWRLLRFSPEQPTGLPPLDAYITVERR